MESRIEEAIQYFEDFPGEKLAAVARLFDVPRDRLWYRLEGRQPKKGSVDGGAIHVKELGSTGVKGFPSTQDLLESGGVLAKSL